MQINANHKFCSTLSSSGLTAWAEPHGLHGTADVVNQHSKVYKRIATYLHTNIALAIDGIAGFELEAAAVNPKPLVRGLSTSTSSWSTSLTTSSACSSPRQTSGLNPRLLSDIGAKSEEVEFAVYDIGAKS